MFSGVMTNITLWDLPRVTWHIISYLDEQGIFALLRVSHRLYSLASHDNVWAEQYKRFNLHALLHLMPHSERNGRSLYKIFLEDIITSKILKGKFEFEAAEDSDMFNILHVVFIVNEATFGNSHHKVGRGQILITYRSSAEVLQGSLRFSPHLKSFVFCCNTFGSNNRGPVFIVALALANRKWANQANVMFLRHRGGLRLVMTPMIIEGITKGSLVTEADVLEVSRAIVR
eukprot:Tbor_TRINITY_DN3475_c0_g1::TRINITY_DN3475_c0_g1_i1::g.3764::m.3764